MTILDPQSPKKLPARAKLTTFCDHCHTLQPCEQVRTSLGLKWLCAEARSDRKATPTETLSSAEVEVLAAFEAASALPQLPDFEPLPEEDDDFPTDVLDDSPDQP